MHRGDSLAWPGEAQRREERRAEARLAKGIQRLDETKLYHINTLTREQRRLHRDLLNMRAGNIWRKGFTGLGSQPFNHDPAHPMCYNRTQLPTIPLSGKDTKRHRPLKPQSGYSLQARVQEFITNGDGRVDSSAAPLCLPDLKLQPGAAIPSNSTTQGDDRDEGKTEREKGKDGQREKERHRETKKEKEREKDKDKEVEMEKEIDTQTLPPADAPLVPFELLAPDGRLRTVHTLPNFGQALAEARKARYIRHRGKPPSERELTIREIFSRSPKPSHPLF
ncbi:coiled-coil domain-containing protein 190 [Alosa sapidissima]|uniref:coiled-coil domain-containing protein 190 n=1 Tax=Alosa sapidissima TaxID=34773 RepID=UPI001C084733|nr:coiled-coil domain-containing protein 190 [Alosa sapidissima]